MSAGLKIQYRSPKPFFLTGHRPAALLLIHGFTGSCAEMSLLGEYFHQRGYTVHAPLLKGHGTTVEDMEKTGARDWWESVLEGYERLASPERPHVFAVGLSMGGLLALKLAANRPLAGVVSLAAPVYVYQRFLGFSRWVYPIYRYHKGGGGSRHPDVEAYAWGYDRTPVKAAGELWRLMKEVRALLPRVQVPALVAQGRRDETVKPHSAQFIYDRLGSTVKQLRWYEQSGHILTLDCERESVFVDIETFMETCLRKE
ncbi:MAG: alpha/beta fold hydrolase [Bacillota bacterium]